MAEDAQNQLDGEGWYMSMKLGAYRKWFGMGSTNVLGMFWGMPTFSMTYTRENDGQGYAG